MRDRDYLRHTVATLAYRGGKVLRGAPLHFGPFKAEIVAGRVGSEQSAPRREFE